jgi:hypothetical protein
MIDPRYIPTFLSWAQQSFPDLLQNYRIATMPDREDDWQNWAAGLLANSEIAAVGVPNAYEFSDWRDWATRFNEIAGQGS